MSDCRWSVLNNRQSVDVHLMLSLVFMSSLLLGFQVDWQKLKAEMHSTTTTHCVFLPTNAISGRG